MLAVSLMLGAMLLFTRQLRPLLSSLATTRVSNTVNRIVSEAVSEAIDSGELRYERLILL